MILQLTLSLTLLAGAFQTPAKDIKSKDVQKRLAAVEQLAAATPKEAEKALISALKDKDWEVQERAAYALGSAGSSKALKPLVDLCIKGDTERVRTAAALSLGKLDAPAACKLLLKKLGGKTGWLSCEALGRVAIGSSDGFSISKLRRLLGDKDRRIQVIARRATVAGAGAQRAEVLAEALKDPSVRMRAAALEAAAEAADYSVALPAWKHLGDQTGPVIERRVRRVVHAALLAENAPGSSDEALLDFLKTAEAAKRPEELVRLIDMLATAGGFDKAALHEQCAAALADSAASARAAAATALGSIGGEEVLTQLHELGVDKAASVRGAALLALEKLVDLDGEESATEVAWLCERLATDDDESVREMLAVRLGVRELKGADVALYGALGDPNWGVRVCAIVSIGKLGDAKHVAKLASLGEDKDWRIRGAAAVALGHVLAPEAIEALIPLVNDQESLVARSAWRGLYRVSGRDDLALESAPWEKWWEENQSRVKFRDPREVEERRKRYGYTVPDAQIYKGLDVIVLESRGDHIEVLLERMEIVHRKTQGARVDKAELHPDAIFFANCTGEIEPADVERLAWFVRVGGSLFSSCWALHETIERIYPGILRKYETMNEVLDDVGASPCRENSPYLTGVFPDSVRPVYHLEGAHLIEVLDRERAQVLIDSPEAAERHGSGELAAWFQAGHGVIMDSVNHFDLQGLETAVWLKEDEERQAWAIDHMGLSYERWRETRKEKFWGNALKASREIEDLSAFRFVTNFVRAKRLLGG